VTCGSDEAVGSSWPSRNGVERVGGGFAASVGCRRCPMSTPPRPAAWWAPVPFNVPLNRCGAGWSLVLLVGAALGGLITLPAVPADAVAAIERGGRDGLLRQIALPAFRPAGLQANSSGPGSFVRPASGPSTSATFTTSWSSEPTPTRHGAHGRAARPGANLGPPARDPAPPPPGCPPPRRLTGPLKPAPVIARNKP